MFTSKDVSKYRDQIGFCFYSGKELTIYEQDSYSSESYHSMNTHTMNDEFKKHSVDKTEQKIPINTEEIKYTTSLPNSLNEDVFLVKSLGFSPSNLDPEGYRYIYKNGNKRILE